MTEWFAIIGMWSSLLVGVSGGEAGLIRPASALPPLPSAPQPVALTIARHFEDAETATRIAFCESSYNPEAQNSTSSAAGVFQIIDSTWHWITDEPWAERYDMETNVRVAARLQSVMGFSPWAESRSCWG